jgi:hypothetical protein
MDPCPYEDAFPNFDTGAVHRGLTRTSGSGFPYVGGTDSRPTREERRAARKKAKRCKGPVLEYSNLISDSVPAEVGGMISGQQQRLPDPDRPAVRRMEPVESMVNQRETYTIPVLPKASCLYSDAGTPSYFGAAEEDAEEEGFSNFRAAQGEADYMLGGGEGSGAAAPASFQDSFGLRGAAKAGGAMLPEPNLNDNWKPVAPAASYTAYLNDLPSSGAAVPGWASGARPMAPEAGPMEPPMEMPAAVRKAPALPRVPAAPIVAAGGNPKEDRDALLARIEALTGRLEELEKSKRQDSQTEILMFVGTGLFVLFAFDMATRARR